jgi:hypothetical protein
MKIHIYFGVGREDIFRMHGKSVVLALAFCLVPSFLVADSITRVSPATVPLGAAEEFLSIYGDGLEGTVSTMVVYDGNQAVEPGSVSPGLVVAWVPWELTLIPGPHTVEVHATDEQGVRVIGPATFSVAEPEIEPGPPSIAVPEGVYAEFEGLRAGTPVSYVVVATHYDGSPATAVCTPPSGSGFPLGPTTVNCTVTDQYGSASASFVVFVADTTSPLLFLPQDITTATPTVAFSATATDNYDGDLPVTCLPASGSSFPAGTTVVQCVAVDSSANYAFGSFNVTVTVGGAPAITVPSDFTAQATEAGGAIVNYTVSATGDATIVCSKPSGSLFPFGSTTVNCTATNANGSASGTFAVFVGDWFAPVLTLPSPVVNATSEAGAVVNYTATAVDAVDGSVPVTCEPASGTLFPVGVTAVFCTAADLRGNPGYGEFNVTVLLNTDTTPPIINAITASPATLWPPNHQMVGVTVTVNAVDNVDPAPVSRIVSVTSNQPVNGTGDGDTAPDWIITGPLQVDLRSERAGNDDRTYTITIETTDASGNTARASVKVKVTQSRRRAA